MNRKKQEKTVKDVAEEIKAQLKIQGTDGNWDHDEYMFGMFNGLECALATIEGREPEYRRAPKKYIVDRQHEEKLDEAFRLEGLDPSTRANEERGLSNLKAEMDRAMAQVPADDGMIDTRYVDRDNQHKVSVIDFPRILKDGYLLHFTTTFFRDTGTINFRLADQGKKGTPVTRSFRIALPRDSARTLGKMLSDECCGVPKTIPANITYEQAKDFMAMVFADMGLADSVTLSKLALSAELVKNHVNSLLLAQDSIEAADNED